MASARPHEVYASRGCTEAVSRRCRSTQEYNANKKAAAKADAAPAAEAAPKKKRKKLCGFQNFTARDSLFDFHTGKKSEDGGEKRKKKKSKKKDRDTA